MVGHFDCQRNGSDYRVERRAIFASAFSEKRTIRVAGIIRKLTLLMVEVAAEHPERSASQRHSAIFLAWRVVVVRQSAERPSGEAVVKAVVADAAEIAATTASSAAEPSEHVVEALVAVTCFSAVDWLVVAAADSVLSDSIDADSSEMTD